MSGNNVGGISFGVACSGCGVSYVVTAEDAFNGPEFACSKCGHVINLVEVCSDALMQFSEEDLDDIWLCVEAHRAVDQFPRGITPFDRGL